MTTPKRKVGRPPTNRPDKAINMRLPPEIYALVVEQATNRRCSVALIIREAVLKVYDQKS